MSAVALSVRGLNKRFGGLVVAQSIDLTNAGTLDTVSSVGAPASPVGEGLADALSVGGY